MMGYEKNRILRCYDVASFCSVFRTRSTNNADG